MVTNKNKAWWFWIYVHPLLTSARAHQFSSPEYPWEPEEWKKNSTSTQMWYGVVYNGVSGGWVSFDNVDEFVNVCKILDISTTY